jgi:hypothetical protein
MSILLMTGAGAVLALPFGYYADALAGGLACGAGCLEWAGAHRVRRGDLSGFKFLLHAQWLLFLVIAVYAAYRSATFSPADYLRLPGMDALEAILGDASSMESMLKTSTLATCVILVAVSAVYQGGMWCFYRARQRACLPPPLPRNLPG